MTEFVFLISSQATCYPSFMEQLSSSAIAVESRVLQDGNVVTSRGPGTAMEYAVVLVEQLYGKEKADEVSGPLVYFVYTLSSSFCLGLGVRLLHIVDYHNEISAFYYFVIAS